MSALSNPPLVMSEEAAAKIAEQFSLEVGVVQVFDSDGNRTTLSSPSDGMTSLESLEQRITELERREASRADLRTAMNEVARQAAQRACDEMDRSILRQLRHADLSDPQAGELAR